MVLATTLAGLVAMQGLHAAPLLKREGVVRFLNIYFKHKMNLGAFEPGVSVNGTSAHRTCTADPSSSSEVANRSFEGSLSPGDAPIAACPWAWVESSYSTFESKLTWAEPSGTSSISELSSRTCFVL